MTILVLGGGNSPERDVSLRSSAAVAEALKKAGFNVQQADPKDGLEVLNNLAKDNIIFPILHGAEGEDGQIQAKLEELGLPFLGSGSESSKNCFDKALTREILEKNGVKMPQAVVVTAETYKTSSLAQKPHVLKVLRGGSSIGTYLVFDPSKVDRAKVDEVFSLDKEAVVEELIVGPEITVPVLDGKALPVIEIVPPAGGEFDYQNKYNGRTQEICPAKSIRPSKQKEAQEISEKVFKVLGCRHLSRVDIMVDEQGNLYVLENNTLPGMTNQSLFPLSAKVAGMEMPKLTEKFVELVKRDYGIK